MQTSIQTITTTPAAHHTPGSLVITANGTETANSTIEACQPVQAGDNAPPGTEAMENRRSTEGAVTNGVFGRPGVSDDFLVAAGCAQIGENESAQQYGVRAAGIAIPFRKLDGPPLIDKQEPFARVRLYSEIGDQKYSQRHGSAVHVYIPHNFASLPKRSTLFLVEGEFKSMALAESGYAAIGLCGLTGAASTHYYPDGSPVYALNDELAEVLEFHQPARVVFLGDGDVVLNAQFAVEAAKLRKLIRYNKRFAFVQDVTVAKPPVDGPKGIDDCRAHHGSGFTAWFDQLLAGPYEVPPKASPVEIFAELLRRESEQLTKLLTAQGHEASRARLKLLQSAARLWHEPAAPLELPPILCGLLGTTKNQLKGMVKDASGHRAAGEANDSSHSDSAKNQRGHGLEMDFPDVKPWQNGLVNGAALLDAILAVLRRYIVAPAEALIACTLFVLHTYAFDLGDISPLLFITSPTKRCGKTKLFSVLARLVHRPLPASSASPAGIYRTIELHKPTILIDEVDSFMKGDEQLRGLINSGHTRDAAYHLGCVLVGDDYEPRRWSTWAPKIFSGIGRLAGTLQDRAIIIHMRRKRKDEKVERLRFKTRFDELCSQCVRFVEDNTPAIREADPQIPDNLNDRAADNWTPLLVLADLAGGEWPVKARQASRDLSGGEDADEDDDYGVLLLSDVRTLFGGSGRLTFMPTLVLLQRLQQLDERPWNQYGKGQKPITDRQLAKLLKPYGIHSDDKRLEAHEVTDGESPVRKGYFVKDFKEAFASYLPPAPTIRDTATSPVDIGDPSNSEPATRQACSGSENAEKANETEGCSAVADERQQQQPGEEQEPADAIIL